MRRVSTREELDATVGEVCVLVGSYALVDVAKKRTVTRSWPVVVLDDGTKVLLESPSAGARPADDVIARHLGRRVEAVGRLHASAPGGPARLSLRCLAPVQDLRLADG